MADGRVSTRKMTLFGNPLFFCNISFIKFGIHSILDLVSPSNCVAKFISNTITLEKFRFGMHSMYHHDHYEYKNTARKLYDINRNIYDACSDPFNWFWTRTICVLLVILHRITFTYLYKIINTKQAISNALYNLLILLSR